MAYRHIWRGQNHHRPEAVGPHFNELNIKNYLLDGDEVRDLFDRDLGCSNAEREANIKRIILGYGFRAGDKEQQSLRFRVLNMERV